MIGIETSSLLQHILNNGFYLVLGYSVVPSSNQESEVYFA